MKKLTNEQFQELHAKLIKLVPDIQVSDGVVRDVRLCDVLIALNKCNPEVAKFTIGINRISEAFAYLLFYWNFYKNSVDEQSGECLAFLFDLICTDEETKN